MRHCSGRSPSGVQQHAEETGPLVTTPCRHSWATLTLCPLQLCTFQPSPPQPHPSNPPAPVPALFLALLEDQHVRMGKRCARQARLGTAPRDVVPTHASMSTVTELWGGLQNKACAVSSWKGGHTRGGGGQKAWHDGGVCAWGRDQPAWEGV